MSLPSTAPGSYALRSETDGELTPVGSKLTIGREDDCGLVIKMSVISRLHAQIFTRSGQLWIEDAGSTNGTFVNGKRITQAAPLSPQDVISFDAISFRLVPVEPSTARSAAIDSNRTVMGMRAVTAPPADDLPEITVQNPERVRPEEPATVATPLPGTLPKVTEAVAAASKTPPPAGMPASWAESSQLERRSSTMMMSSQLIRELSQPKQGVSGVIAAVRASLNEKVPNLIGTNLGSLGQLFLLDPGQGKNKWEIGRDADSDVVIADESVSGRHAQLLFEGGRWKVVNLMSANGTFVNERKVLSAHLNTGDKIRVGNVALLFDAGGDLPRVGGTSGGLWARIKSGIGRLFGRR